MQGGIPAMTRYPPQARDVEFRWCPLLLCFCLQPATNYYDEYCLRLLLLLLLPALVLLVAVEQ